MRKPRTAATRAPNTMARARRRGEERYRSLQRDGERRAGEGAQAHKARVAQRELTRDAHHQVQGDRHGDVGADGDQLSLQHGADAALFKGPQQLYNYERSHHQRIGKPAVSGGTFQSV